MPLQKLHRRTHCLRLLGLLVVARAVRINPGINDIRATRVGSIDTMTRVFDPIVGRKVSDIGTAEFMDVCSKLADTWTDHGFGFETAAGHLHKNIPQLKPCADSNYTLGQCLSSEEASGKHTLAVKGTSATLADPSPPNGLLWLLRIIGFTAETFDISGRGTASLKSAGAPAFEHRLAYVFKNCWVCLNGVITSKLVHAGLSSRLPDGAKMDQFLSHAGGHAVAKEDMRIFASTVLPIVDCLTLLVREKRMEDAARPRPLPPCSIIATTSASFSPLSITPASATTSNSVATSNLAHSSV